MRLTGLPLSPLARLLACFLMDSEPSKCESDWASAVLLSDCPWFTLPQDQVHSPLNSVHTAKGLEGHPNFPALSTLCHILAYFSHPQIYSSFKALLQVTSSRSYPSPAVTQLNCFTPGFFILIPSPHDLAKQSRPLLDTPVSGPGPHRPHRPSRLSPDQFTISHSHTHCISVHAALSSVPGLQQACLGNVCAFGSRGSKAVVPIQLPELTQGSWPQKWDLRMSSQARVKDRASGHKVVLRGPG